MCGPPRWSWRYRLGPPELKNYHLRPEALLGHEPISGSQPEIARKDCSERDRLIEALTKAAHSVYAAVASDRRHLDFLEDVQRARAAAREAAAALAEHRAETQLLRRSSRVPHGAD